MKLKLGMALISYLINIAKKENGEAAFRHFVAYTSPTRQQGRIEVDSVSQIVCGHVYSF
jgi:hypothetical protein